MVESKRSMIKDITISLLAGYSISILEIVILACFLLLLQISEQMVDVGILVVYISSCFLSGFVIGKKRKSKKFIWGMLVGGLYYLFLLFFSFIWQQALDTTTTDFITSLLICWGSATLGGMLS